MPKGTLVYSKVVSADVYKYNGYQNKDALTIDFFAMEAPKLVLSECIPADPKSESREPSFIGIGACKAKVAVLQARLDLVAAYRVDIEM